MIRSKGVRGRLGIGEKQELIQGRMIVDVFLFNQVCKSLNSNSKKFGFVSEEAALFPEEEKKNPSIGTWSGSSPFRFGHTTAAEECWS